MKIKQNLISIGEYSGKNLKNQLSTVSVVQCSNYEKKLVDEAIMHSLQNIGGLQRFVKKGDHVHIKPNLLTAKPPSKAATTHPLIVKSVVERVMDLGCKVTIGDSPPGLSRPIEEYWQKTGMAEVAAETGAKLVRFEKNGITERQVNGGSYFIAKSVANADVLINLCKLKTHNLTLMTGAIKNMFGTIPGFKKAEYHKQAPHVKKFSKIIVDIFSVTRPHLNIMDAVEIMEGNGPSAGKVKHLGLILASNDAVAIDALASKFMGFEEGEILTTELAYEQGLGEKNFENIEIIGTSLTPYENLQFILPSNHYLKYIPEAVVKVLGKLIWVRPRPDENRCRKCGECIANCPTQAMFPRNGFPLIDYSKCISCFCCDEVCPHEAIYQRMSWLAKKFR